MRIGVDLGGTKSEAVALGPAGRELARLRIDTPSGGYDGVIRAIAELVAAVEGQAQAKAPAIGIGIPGSLSPATGRVRNANFTVLAGHAFDRDLSAALGRPVRVENDANCFALAEAMAGAGQGAETVFGVILGTGVGGGIVSAGRVFRGRNLIAGEWGHNPLPALTAAELPGPACYCGREGCIEAWCSGPALGADHARATGESLDAPSIVARAEAGDPRAQATLERHLDRLARALAGVVNVVDPDLIVLGGGLSNLDHLYRRLPDAMRPHVFSDVFATPILKNRLGDSAGVIGAAWLWPEDDR
ncbi:MAG: ROK family protein [Paracoccaceae bacterium]